MRQGRRAFAVLLVCVGAAVVLFAKGGTPLVTTFLFNETGTGYGVSGDSSSVYTNGVDGVQTYFGVNGRNVVLVTYNTGRTLQFKFNPANSAWQASGLPANFSAEVDLYGVNYYGPFASMGDGTTAQVQTNLEFHYGRNTYVLDYQALAGWRTGNVWLLTWNPSDLPGYPGFWPSDQAQLSLKRRKGNIVYGVVNMPIRFESTPQ